MIDEIDQLKAELADLKCLLRLRESISDDLRKDIEKLSAEGAAIRKAYNDLCHAACWLQAEVLGDHAKGRLSVESEEAANALTKSLVDLDAVTASTRQETECPDCDGEGFALFNAYGAGESQATAKFSCDNCDGEGYVTVQSGQCCQYHKDGGDTEAECADTEPRERFSP